MTTQLDYAPLSFASDLSSHGDSPAVLTADSMLTYRELAELVGDLAFRLGSARRLVALTPSNDVDSLVAYLAALQGGHPLIILPAAHGGALDSLIEHYDPDVLLRAGTGGLALEERRTGTRHRLHPDLALMLSTSGSTGSPKLVRLSHANLQANAEAIAGYLNIGPADRAATTLPMSYCYGLSVINSHLLRGAGLVVTDLSVVDPCFWDLFAQRGVTSFAAVPYTFELLDRIGFEDRDLPSLRYLTQAGGRLGPDEVLRYHELGQRRGWDLFVMYGQTEATARMAYLPPDLAGTHPQAIGVPIPGGAFHLDPVAGLEHGELVYTGPNVMLGYAEGPADLALGGTVSELRTGDLAREIEPGIFEVVGRRARFAKIAGLRVDMGQVERILADLGVPAACAGTDAGLVVAVEGGHDSRLLRKVTAERLGLPRAAVEVHAVERLPRLPAGKVDYPAVLAMRADAGPSDAPAAAGAGQPATAPESVKAIFADALEIDEIGDSETFVSLGGDSLSYVAASVRLEQALGHLPPDWHVRTVRDLEARNSVRPVRPRRRFFAPLESSIVLRAAAIVLIVGTHVGLFTWQGTAHVLMAVAGYNFARFQLGGDRLPRFKRQLASLARVVVPSVAFIGAAYLVTDDYTPANIFLLNAVVGPEEVTTQWHFWFIEVLAYLLVGMMALLAIPQVSRLERRFPLVFALLLTAAGLLTRFEVVTPDLPHTPPILWLFALGWAVARSRTALQRCLVSALAVLTIPGFFQDPPREATLLAGILVLVWIPTIPVPVGLRRLTVLLASSSLYAYLVHWLVYPPLVAVSPHLAVAASLAAGVAYWALSSRVMGIKWSRLGARLPARLRRR